MGSSVPDFDIDEVLDQLNIDEKVSLLSGVDLWHTASVPRLGIPSLRLSDGPNGVRGTRFWNGVPAACLPCGTGLAATWDTTLIKSGGELAGKEALAKGATVILGPTVNMQRSPLGGRGFESFSEDPVLAGDMAAATVNGIQSTGVAAALKHYVCNDGEDRRQLVDAIVTERALREIYLMPFQIAQKDSKPISYMTAYNRVNGVHVSESKKLIQDILRTEWGFDGLVMSDWFGVYSTAESIKAGLDLEMPGPSYARGKLVKQAVGCGKLSDYDLNLCIREVLKLVKRQIALGIPERGPETTVDSPETAALLRNLSASGIVLLKNERKMLPFAKEKSLAVIGPNAAIAAYCGGGSAALAPYYAVPPLDGIKAQKSDVKYSLGVPGWKNLPLLSLYSKRKSGAPGADIRIYLDPPTKTDRVAIDEISTKDLNIIMVDYGHEKITDPLYWGEVECQFTPEETAEFEFGLTIAGTGKLYVDGKMIVDNETTQRPGDSYFGSGTMEEIGSIQLEAGNTYTVLVKFGTLPTQTFTIPGVTPFGAGGLRLGCHKKIDVETEIKNAVELAKTVDQVVICAGLNQEWEGEGADRNTMALPPGSDELIKRVIEVNPNTAVVVQSGTPVEMPWAKDAGAILQAWYGGNETGNAIADVLLGEVNPSGKLPLSFPIRNEDNPAFLNYKSEGNRTLYGEDIYIGYRFYEKTRRDVAFPFGHGLSYTTFEIKNLQVDDAKDEVTVTVDVSNTGSRNGAQVVQVYVAQDKPTIGRPPKELKGFKKIFLEVGATEKVQIKISKKYASSYWDELRNSWIMERGKYTLLVGDSSALTPLKGSYEVSKTSWWRGL